MAAAYLPEDLKTSAKDRARFMLGDTGVLKDADEVQVWMLQDEEIQAYIDSFGYAEGVAQLAEGLAVRYAQQPDQYEDEAGVKVSWSKRIDAWIKTAERLRAGVSKTSTMVGGSPVCGRLSGPDMTGVRP